MQQAGAHGENLKLALEHHRAGRLAEAEALYRQMIEAFPVEADAFHLLGLIELQRGQSARAVRLIERADELSPSNAVFLSNLGDAYQRLGASERAQECCLEALRLEPDLPAAHVNLGNALVLSGSLDAAEAAYAKGIAADASLARGRLNLGLLKLLQGDYAAGLPLYEARLERTDASDGGDTRRLLAKVRDIPRWRGEAVKGKRLLLWTEQGLGDSVMMMRFLPWLAERGASHIAVCCEPALTRLMQALPQVGEVFSETADEDWRQRFDLHCPMMSLPLAFGTRLDTIPRGMPYLVVPADLKRKWSLKASTLPHPGVGLVWAGGTQTFADPRRSVTLATFSPLLSKRGVSFVSLQKGPQASQLESASASITDWTHECVDLMETAALIGELDLVISVDTAVAHLAGALGKPVWLLNRLGSEWRWLLERSDSPWYPTMRIFRQKQSGWNEVVRELEEALSDFTRTAAFAPTTWLSRVRRLFGPS